MNFIVCLSLLFANIIGSSILGEETFDWNFYLKYNPDVVQAGIITKERAYEHFQNYGKNEKRWHSSKDKPNFQNCNRARDIIEKENNQTLIVYCDSLIGMKIKDWKGVGPVADWKFYLFYDMYSQENQQPSIIINSNKSSKISSDFKVDSPKICFVVKPGRFTFETMKMRKIRLSQQSSPIKLNDLISSLQQQINPNWKAFFISTTKHSRYKNQLLDAFHSHGKDDHRLTNFVIPEHQFNRFDNSNNSHKIDMNSLVDIAIEYVKNLKQCSWISITSIDNRYGSNVVNEVLQTKYKSNGGLQGNNSQVDMLIAPLDSKYFAEQDYIKRNEVSWDQRCISFTSLLNSQYLTFSEQPVLLPGKVFLEAVFFSRKKLLSENFKLSKFPSLYYNNNSETPYNSAYPCIHKCSDGLLLQYLVRNRGWSYHRISLDGLKSIIFQGPYSPSWCIAARNVWFDNIDVNRVGCYSHDAAKKTNPSEIENPLYDWKYYDNSLRLCMRLSAYGVFKLGVVHSQSKTAKRIKIKIMANRGSSISSRSSAEKIIWNDVIKKIIIYSDRYASLMANLSLVLYDIQPITSSIQSKEVLMNNIKIFSSAIKLHSNLKDKSAFYIIHVDSIDLPIINPYFNVSSENVVVIERSSSWHANNRSIIDHHSLDKHFYLINHIFDNEKNNFDKRKVLQPTSFNAIVFCSTNSRGPLVLRQNGQWLNRFHELLANSNIGMVSVSASTYINYNLSSQARNLPVNMEVFALKSSIVHLILDLYKNEILNIDQNNEMKKSIHDEYDLNLSSSSMNRIKTIVFKVLDVMRMKIGSLLHYSRLSKAYYEFSPVLPAVAKQSVLNIKEQYIRWEHLFYQNKGLRNMTSWCEIKPSEVVFMRWGGEKLGWDATTGYECGNNLAVTGSRYIEMMHTIQELSLTEANLDLTIPESPIGGLLYDLYRDSSSQVWDAFNYNRNHAMADSHIYSKSSNDNVCIVVRATASHDREHKKKSLNSETYFHEMDIQGLITSFYRQTNPNWIAYFVVTDQSGFDSRLKEILNEFRHLYKDTSSRLNHIIVPSDKLPKFTRKDAGYTATDYVLKQLVHNPLCRWLTATNGDNAYGSEIVENTINVKLVMERNNNTNRNPKLVTPDMVLHPFSSRNLAEKYYVERKLKIRKNLDKRCVYFEAMTSHTLLAFAVQSVPKLGSIDLASIFLQREKLLKENVYFSNFTSLGNGDQDGLFVHHLAQVKKWSFNILPLDGLKSIIFHGPSELLCIAEGNVWLDYPGIFGVGCFSQESVIRYRQQDITKFLQNGYPVKFDWEYFDKSDQICLRVTRAF